MLNSKDEEPAGAIHSDSEVTVDMPWKFLTATGLRESAGKARDVRSAHPNHESNTGLVWPTSHQLDDEKPSMSKKDVTKSVGVGMIEKMNMGMNDDDDDDDMPLIPSRRRNALKSLLRTATYIEIEDTDSDIQPARKRSKARATVQIDDEEDQDDAVDEFDQDDEPEDDSENEKEDELQRKRAYKPRKKNRREGKGPVRVAKYRGGNHTKKDQNDPTLAPWAVKKTDIPDDGQLRIDKFGRTKEEVIQMRRDANKARRDKRSDEKKKADANQTKKWREQNAEYVEAFDYLRKSDAVEKYSPEKVEELRLLARHKLHETVLKQYLEKPVRGVRAPETGKQVQQRCEILTKLLFDVSSQGIHLIIIARKSWKAVNNEHIGLESTNWLILGKLINDFVVPTPVLSAESIVWHGRGAEKALPWIARDDDDGLPLNILDEALWNETNDRRFCTFFAEKPDDSTVGVPIRGVDGGSTNADSWLGLQARYPKLNIILIFTFAEVYVRFRSPVDSDWFYRTDPYDECLYSFFPLQGLVDHVNGTKPQPKYEWLMSEWKAAGVWRQAFSVAHQSEDDRKIKDVQDAYFAQRFRPRNGLPLYL
ncbi:hypothetical protein IFR05_007454 [Cadophora sp. M221]|nr:hypothetical protein IFR05_007454 [Cadophora sp. M221]